MRRENKMETKFRQTRVDVARTERSKNLEERRTGGLTGGIALSNEN